MSFPAKKVLMFSVSIGSGHDSVAGAIAEEIKLRSPDSQVLIVDTFKYINPILNKVVVGSYMETIKFTPKVWGYLYDQAEDGERLIDLGQILSKLLSPKLEMLLGDFKPDVLLCTHAFPAGILSVLKERNKITTPLLVCVTDFHVHSFWMHDNIDFYVIPAEDLKYSFKKHILQEEKIKAFGIPIRPQFYHKYSKEQIRKELEFQEKSTLLVMGGGLGLGKIEEIVKKILNETDFQVIAVTGTNNKLKENLEKLKEEKRLRVFGFVNNVAELMTAADLLVTKPGGVTTAEALAMNLPLIIMSSLPGQEDRNTQYLLNKGVAIKTKKLDDFLRELWFLRDNPLRLIQMKEMISYLKKPDAVINTVDNIWLLTGEAAQNS